MRLLVLGGTRFLGRHVVTAALERGHDVATFTRGVSGEPPDGARALRLCTRPGLPRSPQMVLAAARSTPLPQVPDLPHRRAG